MLATALLMLLAGAATAWIALTVLRDGATNITTPAAVDLGGTSLVVALDDRAPLSTGANAQITIVDLSTGSIVGPAKAGYSPWVVLRPSKGQVLVSQLLGAGPEDGPTLRIFDLDDLTPVITLPMPDRPGNIVYSPGMALSSDERFLYYEKRRSRCPQGGNAAVCDLISVGVIDLDQGVEVAEAELPVGCGIAGFVPSSTSDVLALCGFPGPTLFRVTLAGSVTKLAPFPGRDIGTVTAGVTEDGTYYVVYTNGRVLAEKSSSPFVDLLPDEGSRAGFSTHALFDQGRSMFAYTDNAAPASDGFPLYQGIVIFNRADPTDFQTFVFPFPAKHVAPVDSERVAILSPDGLQLSFFDLTAGEVVGNIPLPAQARWLIGR